MFLLYMNPILIAAAVVPAVFLLIRVYRADRLEPEPSGLLLSLILRGVFATVIAMVLEELGSALWENLGYVAMYGLSTALVRAVTAVPGHACFGVFMGVYYGRAKRYDNDGDLVNAKRCRTMAILMPALLHGAYDFIATMEDPNCEWVFLVFVLALFAVSLKLVRVGSRSDRYIDGGEGPLFF